MGTLTFTRTVIFYGAVTSIVSTVVKPVIAAGSAAQSGIITAVAKDAAGNVVSGATLYAVSGTTTVVSAIPSAVTSNVGVASFSLTGILAGTSSVVVQNVATGSTATVSAAAVSVRVGSATPATITLTLNKPITTPYVPGEQGTLTLVVRDAAGETVADITSYAAFTAQLASTNALQFSNPLPGPTLSTGSSTGTLTFTFNAPLAAGDFKISAKGGAGLAASQAGLEISVTGVVGPSAAEAAAAEAIAAAADAAAEATDAANAATDAANAAAEAADAATAASQDAADAANAATDAVAALSVQVGTLIAGLKAQLRSLTNLIIRMQKKLNALAKR